MTKIQFPGEPFKTQREFINEPSRLQAIYDGDDLYWSEKLCVNGHSDNGYTLRRVKDRECRECMLSRLKRYYYNGLDKKKDKARRNTPEYKARMKVVQARWRKNNLSYYNAWMQERKTSQRTNTPPWVNRAELRAFYLARPPGYHVDHIVALKGVTKEGWRVSGLHVLHNLQYLTGPENKSKGNRVEG